MIGKTSLPTLDAIRRVEAPEGRHVAEAFDQINQKLSQQPSYMDQVSPIGTINGTNKTFILPVEPNPVKSFHLFHNGLLVTGYTIKGRVLTMNAAPAISDTLLVSFRY